MSRTRAAVWATAAAGWTLVAGAALPFWGVPAYTRSGTTIQTVPLWVALEPRNTVGTGGFWDPKRNNLFVAAGLVAVATGAWLGAFRLLHRPPRPGAAADYAEGHSGAVPDGRANPPAG